MNLPPQLPDSPAEPNGSRELQPTESAAPGPSGPRLSSWATAIAAVFLAANISFFAALHFTVPLLERVDQPEQALALVVGRTMDLEEALPQAQAWERLLYELNMETGTDEIQQAIEWYGELAAFTNQPVASLELSILEGEAGHIDRLRARIARWLRDREPYPTFASWLKLAYLEQTVPMERERLLQAQLAETLPAGWFYDKLMLRLAGRARDGALLASATTSLTQRAGELLERMRGLLLVDVVLIIGGLAAFAIVARSMPLTSWRIGTGLVPPLWNLRSGAAVLIQGGALAGGVTLVLFFGDVGDSPVRFVAIPLINLPLLLLAQRYLLAPHRLTLTEGLGLLLLPRTVPRLGLVWLMLVAAGFAGEWLVGLLSDVFGVVSHWTEWFDTDLVWGRPAVVGIVLFEYVVLAPLFEELAFRGLLFATLRSRFGFLVSAITSAAIFGLAHGYGVLGFLSVMWSGVLWAWAYERTGSLLPGILAHALNNLLVSLTIIVMLRL